MTALPSLVSSASSSSEDTSSVSAEVDSNIRASLTLPGLSTEAILVNSQPASFAPMRHQNRPRFTSSNQQQMRNANRAEHSHCTPHGHQANNSFHHGNSNHVNKSSSGSGCNLSVFYSYLLAAISSVMVVVGIYFSLTRFNSNYLYLSLAGLLLEALGACLSCVGNVQLNRKARRKLRLSDDDFEAIDRRGLTAAAAASHILNSRGLVQINNLNPVALRNATNPNFTTSSVSGTDNNESLLVMINSESGPTSSNPPTSAQKPIKKVPLENGDPVQLDHDIPQQNSDQFIGAEGNLPSSTENNEVSLSQLSLNMIPQYFSNGVGLGPKKSCQSSGPTSSTVINLTSGAFGKIDAAMASLVNDEKSLKAGQVAFQLGEEEPAASSSNIETSTATPRGPSSGDQRKTCNQLDSASSRNDATNAGAPSKAAMGPLSQSQIVNVNGRQFLILPLNDKKTSLLDQSTSNDITVDSQGSFGSSELPRSNKNYSIPTTSSQQQSRTTEELIDKIKAMTNSDTRQQMFVNVHAGSGQSFKNFSKPQPLLRKSSFTFDNTKVSLNNNPETLSTSDENFSPRGLRQSLSFNDKFSLTNRLTADNEASLVGHKFLNLNSCKNNTNSGDQQNSKLRPAVISEVQMLPKELTLEEIQPCSSRMSETLLDNTQELNRTTHPIDETDDLSQSHSSRDLENSDRREFVEGFVASKSIINSNGQELFYSAEPQPYSQNAKQHQQPNNLILDMQPSTSSPSSDLNQEDNRTKKYSSGSDSRESSSNARHRTTLIMGLSGEEELIEINEADIDKMSMLPPSYDSLMSKSYKSQAIE